MCLFNLIHQFNLLKVLTVNNFVIILRTTYTSIATAAITMAINKMAITGTMIPSASVVELSVGGMLLCVHVVTVYIHVLVLTFEGDVFTLLSIISLSD